jgi:hypothetical protein
LHPALPKHVRHAKKKPRNKNTDKKIHEAMGEGGGKKRKTPSTQRTQRTPRTLRTPRMPRTPRTLRTPRMPRTGGTPKKKKNTKGNPGTNKNVLRGKKFRTSTNPGLQKQPVRREILCLAAIASTTSTHVSFFVF